MQVIKEEKKNNEFGLNLEEMTQAGLYLGHKTSRTHPKMKPYITGERNNIHIIDLEKTIEMFEKALKFIKKLISEGKVLLFIGTKIQAKNLVKETAQACGLPYINERWLGGTFTNFETIKKRLANFKELENKKTTGDLEKYTKKERAKIDKTLRDLEVKFGGIKNLEKLPDAIFVLDMKKDILAVKEAINKEVFVIAIADADSDPSLTDYLIPANDDAISSIKYILEKVKEVVLKNKPKNTEELKD